LLSSSIKANRSKLIDEGVRFLSISAPTLNRQHVAVMPGTPLQLIVGLGNPGPEYQLTRHNAGFWFVDMLAAKYREQFRHQSKLQGDTCKIRIGTSELMLLKPQTFMNHSGRSVRAASDYFKIPPGQILVAYDELDLPLGTVRLKVGGGHGGHNGMRDIVAQLGADFWRLRIGIGHPGDKSQVVDYVLHRAPKDEEDQLLASVQGAMESLPAILEQGAEKAMNAMHRKK
jgi:PTH1 family peptidyl-tRNA hydrolase